MDIASRTNKELEEKLTSEKYLLDQARVERDGLIEQVERYKGKLRKCLAMIKNGGGGGEQQQKEGELGERYAEVRKVNN